ncbi:hypothetical protein [Noviherbaspirillum denitrificans]|uniref:Uncharacterized protein n=1 Tax=Noviherbaspirillum denitrificans TaxID=1968433 RepID=A0A254TGC7_9BURK|nr:hypothetical protein [Noviherbaspirillum denitrificans]OWW21664.1 hypothetical protein AYR66_21415 [Noviherbaspirillum denitrificans]
MATRSKRWNGNVDSLSVEFLKDVMAKMADYGDRVQFSLVTGGPVPSYQVTNTLGKAMAFDGNHHLLKPEGHEFAGANATQVFTIEQVKTAVSGFGLGPRTSTSRTVRTVRSSSGGTGTRTSAARLEEQFAAQRYEYFRNNRQSLPATISQHTEEITQLMKQGKSVEDAFGEVLKKYF